MAFKDELDARKAEFETKKEMWQTEQENEMRSKALVHSIQRNCSMQSAGKYNVKEVIAEAEAYHQWLIKDYQWLTKKK